MKLRNQRQGVPGRTKTSSSDDGPETETCDTTRFLAALPQILKRLHRTCGTQVWNRGVENTALYACCTIYRIEMRKEIEHV